MNVWINYANLSKINISQCHASDFDQEHTFGIRSCPIISQMQLFYLNVVCY